MSPEQTALIREARGVAEKLHREGKVPDDQQGWIIRDLLDRALAAEPEKPTA